MKIPWIRSVHVVATLVLAVLMACASMKSNAPPAYSGDPGGSITEAAPTAPQQVVTIVREVVHQAPQVAREAVTSAPKVLATAAVAAAAPSPVSYWATAQAIIEGNPTLAKLVLGGLLTLLVGGIFWVLKRRKVISPAQAKGAEEMLTPAVDAYADYAAKTPTPFDDLPVPALRAMLVHIHEVASQGDEKVQAALEDAVAAAGLAKAPAPAGG